jgi:hypothetical protein
VLPLAPTDVCFGDKRATSNANRGTSALNGGLAVRADHVSGRCVNLKLIGASADQLGVEASRLPMRAGPVPDRLTIWPVDDGRYGLDATFQGASGYERAEHHREELSRHQVPHTFRQELNDGWTLRFGPLRAVDVAAALGAFVY